MQIDSQESSTLSKDESIVWIERLQDIFDVVGRPEMIGQVLGRCPDIDAHRQGYSLAKRYAFQFVDLTNAQQTTRFEEFLEGDQVAGLVEGAQANGFDGADVCKNVHEGDEAEEGVEKTGLMKHERLKYNKCKRITNSNLEKGLF